MKITPAFKGEVRCVLKDEEGKIKKDTGYNNNMIMDNFLNDIFKNETQPWLNWPEYGDKYYDGFQRSPGVMRNCSIGSGDTPSTRNMNNLETVLSSNHDEKNHFARSAEGTSPVWVEQQYVFYGDNGTGTIREVAVFRGNSMTGRIVLTEPIEKLSTDILEVFYRISFDIPTRVYSGTITGGQRDGVTDVNWNLYITDDMLYHGWAGSRWYISTYEEVSNILAGLFYMGEEFRNPIPAYVRIGDSNAPSDIQADSGAGTGHLKGNQLYEGNFTFYEPNSYINGSYQRSGRVGFEENIANHQIAEMLIFPTEREGGMSVNYPRPILRITFDPALDNQELYRLYLDFTVSLGTIS